MRRFNGFCLILATMLGSMVAKASDVNLDNLVKVSPENDVKCVEYYNFKGALYCSTTAISSQSIDPHLNQYEKLKILFDDRPWLAAWGKHDETISMVEYVPKGEDIDHWNELITSQYFPGLQDKVTPKQFADLLVKQLQDADYKPIVTFLEDTDNQVIFEYRILAPQNQIVDEMQMVTTNENGLYVLHYAIKKADMGQPNRDKWQLNLKKTTIK